MHLVESGEEWKEVQIIWLLVLLQKMVMNVMHRHYVEELSQENARMLGAFCLMYEQFRGDVVASELYSHVETS